MRTRSSLLLALTCFLLVCCDGGSSRPNASRAESEIERHRFPVRGVIVDLEADGATALVNHEAIPNYMESMTMPIRVRNTNELAAFEAGNAIAFDLVVTDTSGWMENLRRIDRAGLKILETADYVVDARPSPPASDIRALEVGDRVPDTVLTNQFGRPFRLSEFEGEALGLTFIYTRCPFPEFCPRMSTNFAQVSEILSRVKEWTNWRLITISFDPDFDTPEVLERYAGRYARNSEKWLFATGGKAAIGDLTRQFGVGLAPMATGVGWDHNFRSVVIDPEGHIRHIFSGNTWQPIEFALEMCRTMSSAPGTAAGAASGTTREVPVK